MADTLVMKGEMRGHTDWVTSIATTAEDANMIISASRDKSVMVWTLTHEDETYGK